MSQSFLQAKTASPQFSSAQRQQSSVFSSNKQTDVFSQLSSFRNETLRRSSIISLESPASSNFNRQAALSIGTTLPSSTKHSCQPITPQNLTSLQIQQLSPKKTFLPSTDSSFAVHSSQLTDNLRSSQIPTTSSNIFTNSNISNYSSKDQPSFLSGQPGMLGTITSNISSLQKDLKEFGTQKYLANSVVQTLSVRKPSVSSGNSSNFPEKSLSKRQASPQATSQQLFSYSPNPKIENIFSPDRLAVRLSSLPNAQFTNFDYPKTNKLSGTTRISINSSGNQATSNTKKRSPSQNSVSSSVNSLNELRIQIQSAKRANQQKTHLPSSGISTSSSSQSAIPKSRGIKDNLLTDIADLTRCLSLFSSTSSSNSASNIFKAR